MYKVACVHGVNQSAEDLRNFHKGWAKVVSSHFRSDKWEFVPVVWESVGMAVADWTRLLWSPQFYAYNYQLVANQLEAEQPDLIIAHSMGTVIILDALAHTPGLCQDARLLSVGSPLSHPLLRRRMAAAGLLDADLEGRFVSLVNRDDDVCALRLFGRSWMVTKRGPYKFVEVSVPGTGGFWEEHPAELYLETKEARSEIARLLQR